VPPRNFLAKFGAGSNKKMRLLAAPLKQRTLRRIWGNKIPRSHEESPRSNRVFYNGPNRFGDSLVRVFPTVKIHSH